MGAMSVGFIRQELHQHYGDKGSWSALMRWAERILARTADASTTWRRQNHFSQSGSDCCYLFPAGTTRSMHPKSSENPQSMLTPHRSNCSFQMIRQRNPDVRIQRPICQL